VALCPFPFPFSSQILSPKKQNVVNVAKKWLNKWNDDVKGVNDQNDGDRPESPHLTSPILPIERVICMKNNTNRNKQFQLTSSVIEVRRKYSTRAAIGGANRDVQKEMIQESLRHL
jgi:hypothetical protein